MIMQIRRAGVSICSNIAEGAARLHPKEFAQFLYISLGSVSEIETQLEIALRLEYLKSTDLERESLNRIRRMLIGLIKHIQEKNVSMIPYGIIPFSIIYKNTINSKVKSQ